MAPGRSQEQSGARGCCPGGRCRREVGEPRGGGGGGLRGRGQLGPLGEGAEEELVWSMLSSVGGAQEPPGSLGERLRWEPQAQSPWGAST